MRSPARPQDRRRGGHHEQDEPGDGGGPAQRGGLQREDGTDRRSAHEQGADGVEGRAGLASGRQVAPDERDRRQRGQRDRHHRTPAEGVDEQGSDDGTQRVDRRAHPRVRGHGPRAAVPGEEGPDRGEGEGRHGRGPETLQRARRDEGGKGVDEGSCAGGGHHDRDPDEQRQPDAEEVTQPPEDRAAHGECEGVAADDRGRATGGQVEVVREGGEGDGDGRAPRARSPRRGSRRRSRAPRGAVPVTGWHWRWWLPGRRRRG
uniref:Uncharacterized protein n=1 Tax=Janibacter limosus TaxID=53458 RepID=A0AC61U616_9MICO|nr:hypothetical protein [Janibacter limosus]